ncbi:hypothetical protein BHM03_00031138, partial [Ensete ventricosum]
MLFILHVLSSAYTLDEVEEKANKLRAMTKGLVGDDTSSFQYVDPVLERLDQKGCIRFRLSRAATKYVNGKHFRVFSSRY